jgi:hypothetical protein
MIWLLWWGANRLEHVHDALSVEMYACLEAPKACSSQGMLRVLIESDCCSCVGYKEVWL